MGREGKVIKWVHEGRGEMYNTKLMLMFICVKVNHISLFIL